MMRTMGWVLIAAGLVAAAGCSSEQGAPEEGDEQFDRWDPWTEDPNKLLPGASAKLTDVITPDEAGKQFGVADDSVPYPDTYWPFVDDGIDAKWNGNEESALTKYMNLTNPTRLEAAKNWEKKQHGSEVPGVASWWGHCPGWTAAAMFNKPILHPVFAKLGGSGIEACTEGSEGCIKFEIGDINALEAEVFVDSAGGFIGARCDTKPSDIKRDKYGRVERNGTGCKGLNAGALMIVLAKRMKTDHQALAIDAQNDFNTDEIWNQPAYAYKVYKYDVLSTKDAIKAVVGTARAPRTYTWNRAAKGFVRVDVGIKWVTEHGPNRSVVSGTDSTRETRFVAVLELDKGASDTSAKIIGGEFVQDDSVGATRLKVPPFVWTAAGPGPENLSTSVNGNNHNPYVKPSQVQKLVALGSTPASTN